jgi:hypothetical protein
MKARLILFALLGMSILFFPACDDDDTIDSPSPDASTFMPLQVGAFWVYETYRVDPGEVINVISTDTLAVTNSYQDGEDIVYEVTKTNGFIFDAILPDSYRLSEGILYGENAEIQLSVSSTQSGEIIRTDSVPVNEGYIDFRFVEELTTVTSPAGSFECVNFQGTITAFDASEPINGKLIDNYYAKGVGLVRSTNYFWNNALEVGFRLVSYELP